MSHIRKQFVRAYTKCDPSLTVLYITSSIPLPPLHPTLPLPHTHTESHNQTQRHTLKITTVTQHNSMALTIIPLKVAIGDLLQSPHCTANCLQHHTQVTREQSCATHQALITCNMSCATWYQGTAQLLSLTEFKSQSF